MFNFFHNRKSGSLALLLSMLSFNSLPIKSYADSGNLFTSMNAEGDAYIESPEQCSSLIGAGGNYIGTGIRLQGKCEGSAISPRIDGPRSYQKHVTFKIDPNKPYSHGSDRSELAYIPYFPFGSTVYIGFRMKVPSTSEITNDFFYPLQLWQKCNTPARPIAGLRISRNSSHSVAFMTRGEIQDGNIVSANFKPDVWHQIVLAIRANPLNSGTITNDGAVFRVFMDGKQIGESFDPYGWYANHAGIEGNCSQSFRVKYGIYKAHEQGKTFEVSFDDLRIGKYYNEVVPW